MRLVSYLLAAIMLALLPSLAQAQCTGGQLVNCPDAVNLQSTDYLLGYQNAQTPHYRRITPGGIVGGGFPASFSTLNASGGGVLSGPFTAAGQWGFSAPGTGIAVTGSVTIGGTLGVSGLANLSGGGSMAGVFSGTPTFSGALTLTGGGSLTGTFVGTPVFTGNVTMATATVTGTATLPVLRGRPQNFTTGTLPTTQGPGDSVFVTDCLNGVEIAGSGTGCRYETNDAGTWTARPYPPTLKIGIGSQQVILGQNFNTQGVGPLVATASGTFIAGNAVTVNGAGTLIDAGVPPGGGGGGGGTVANCAAAGVSNAIYPAPGTTVGCLAQVTGSVLARTAGGVLGETTALPSGLTIPSPTISTVTLTGTASAVNVTLSGVITTAASTTAGANIVCTVGVAPSAPVNNTEWCTAAGHFGRFAGVTVGPFIGTAQLSGTAPIVATAGAFSCPTCLTSAAGGALTVAAGSGLTITSSALSTSESTRSLGGVFFDGLTTVVNGTYGPWYFPSAAGHVVSFKAYTGGTSTPSFNVTVQANGVNVPSCTSIAVTAANTAASPLTVTCASTVVTLGQGISVVIAGVAGTPFSSLVQVIGTQSQI